MSTLSLGWKNIWRNRRRTLISMSAVGVGLILVLFYSGLLAGMLGEAKNQLEPPSVENWNRTKRVAEHG